MAACASCGTANPDGFRFCGACGSPLATTAPREERKTITVLFADLAGFTDRAERMDPEDVRAFLLPYYDVLSSEIDAHGGRVERYLGDGVMALFGAPVAHEDDPERAVRAALRILQRIPGLGLDLHVRIGVNTGKVLFAAGGPGRDTGAGGDATAGDVVTGDAVNLAARLQGLAPVDGVVVGEATYAATARLFRYEPREPALVKGHAEPIVLWQALSPVSRTPGELRRETTPFVGRDLELTLLTALFDRARETPSLEVATIVAEPGMGKSRLVRELARYVDALPELVTRRVGRCLPYGDGISFWALSEIVKAQAGILDTDDQVALSAKLDAVLTEPDPSLRAWMKERLGPLVGLEVNAEPPQPEEAYTAWRRFMESIAATGPLVLIVEDLHWADEGMVAFLSHLAERTSGFPILLVATARPEVEERHPSWLGRARRSTVISLAGLPDRAMRTLVDTAIPDVSPELLAGILERAGGSPLYAEQLAAMARDRLLSIAGGSLDAAGIPPTIAALLAARIDALPPEAKAALLDASVVGKTFWSGAVVSLSGRERTDVESTLAGLAHRELIRPVFPSTMAGETEFAFWHALVRDTAYGELTRAARARRHVAAAHWLLGRLEGSGDEYAELLARHFATAATLAREAGDGALAAEAAEAAVDWLDAAAGRIATLSPGRAVPLFEEALDLAGAGSPRHHEILGRYGEAVLSAGRAEDAERILAEAADALVQDGNLRLAARAMTRQSSAQFALGVPGHTALDAAAVRLLEQDGPSEALVDALCELAASKMLENDFETARDVIDRAGAIAAGIGTDLSPLGVENWAELRHRCGDPDGVESLCRRADVPGLMGQRVNLALAYLIGDVDGPLASLDSLERVASDALAHDQATRALFAHLNSIPWAVRAGAWHLAWARIGEIRQPMLDRGWSTFVGQLDGFTAELAAVQGRLGEAVRLAGQALERARAYGYLYLVNTAVAATAIAADAAGDRLAALKAARELDEIVVHRSDPDFTWRLPALARICTGAGEVDLAARLASGIRTDLPVNGHAVASAQASIAEALGDLDEASRGYRAVAEAWRAFGVPAEEAHALTGLGRCLLALGDREAGVASLREARATWERLGSPPDLAAVDGILAAAGEAP